MAKKNKLPGSEVLFGRASQHDNAESSEHDNVKTLEHRNAVTSKRDDAKAAQDKTERITLYMTPDLWSRVEISKMKLFQEYGVKVNKSSIICAILNEKIDDLERIIDYLERV